MKQRDNFGWLLMLAILCILTVPQTVSALTPFTNGDFETGDFTGWGNNSNSTVTNADAEHGIYSAELFEDEGVQPGIFQEQLEFPSGAQSINFWIKSINQSGATLGYLQTFNYGTFEERNYPFTNNGDGWEYHTIDISGESFSSGGVIAIYTPSDNSAFTDYLIDNITITAPTPTPTPTVTPYGCNNVTLLNVEIAENSTSWQMSGGSAIWGVEILDSTNITEGNITIGNVSYYNCGDQSIDTSTGSSAQNVMVANELPISPFTPIIAAITAVFLCWRRVNRM